MHELAICQALMEQIETIARDEQAERVTAIHLGIGPLSGVEPRLLEQAFYIASAGSIAADAELTIKTMPVEVSCSQCGQCSEALPTRLVCGHCGDWRTKLVSGDELQLEHVEFTRQAQKDSAESKMTPREENDLFG